MNMKFSITAQAAAALLIAICFFIGLAWPPPLSPPKTSSNSKQTNRRAYVKRRRNIHTLAPRGDTKQNRRFEESSSGESTSKAREFNFIRTLCISTYRKIERHKEGLYSASWFTDCVRWDFEIFPLINKQIPLLVICLSLLRNMNYCGDYHPPIIIPLNWYRFITIQLPQIYPTCQHLCNYTKQAIILLLSIRSIALSLSRRTTWKRIYTRVCSISLPLSLSHLHTHSV